MNINRFLLIALLAVGLGVSASAQVNITLTGGTGVVVNKKLFGVNLGAETPRPTGSVYKSDGTGVATDPWTVDRTFLPQYFPTTLADMGATVMRYPGGHGTSTWHWDDPWYNDYTDLYQANADGGVSTRATRKLPSQFGENMDIDEYMNQCIALNTEPMVGCNLLAGEKYGKYNPTLAASAYANLPYKGDPVAETGAMLKYCSDNFPSKPVQYIFLDNEVGYGVADGSSAADNVSVAAYPQMVQDCSIAFKAQSPGVKILTSHGFDPNSLNTKNLVISKGQYIDLVDAHFYYVTNSTWNQYSRSIWMAQDANTLGGYPTKIRTFYNNCATAGYPNIKLAVNEWNLLGVGPQVVNPVTGVKTYGANDYDQMLVMTDMLMMFVREKVEMASMWALYYPNGSSNLIQAHDNYNVRTPFYALKLFKEIQDQPTQNLTSSSTDMLVLSALQNASSTTPGATPKLELLLLSKNSSVSRSINLDLGCFKAQAVSGFSYVENPATGGFQTQTLTPVLTNGKVVVNCAGLSVTQLTVDLAMTTSDVDTAVNHAPVANNVSATGTVATGQTLTGTYTYVDMEADAQGTSTFRWLKSATATFDANASAIPGATASTYSVQVADVGLFLYFEVTPVALTGVTTGTPVVSGRIKAMPTVSVWPTASAITYGQTLASSNLTGGSASVPGTFAFTAPSTAPSAGTKAQSVTFTPTDTANYNPVSATVNVAVPKITPSVTTQPTASSISYSQPLSYSTLSGGVASVPGNFGWTTLTTVPVAGTTSQAYTFIPIDTTNYNNVTGTVSITATVRTVTGTNTWTGLGADNNWSTAANWSLGTAPIVGDTLVFTGVTRTASVNDLPAGTNYPIISFRNLGGTGQTGNFTFSGNAVTLTNYLDAYTSTSVVLNDTVGLNLELGSGTRTFHAYSNHNLTLSGVISGSGSFTKAKVGVLSLTNNNTYAGATAITAGTLQFAKTGSLYNGTVSSWTAANIKVSANATLALNVGGTGEFTIGNVTTLLSNLGGANGTSAAGFASGAALALDPSNATGGTFSVTDVIANSTGTGGGALGVTKLGTNTLVLSANNTYTGPSAITGGILQFAQAGSLYNGTVSSWTAANIKVAGNATLALNVGGTGEFTTGNVTTLLTNLGGANGNSTAGFAAGAALALDPSNATGGTFIVTDVIANSTGTGGGALGVTKLGSNTLVLSANNTYTGPTRVSGGTLRFAKTGSLYNGITANWTAANIKVAGNATLALNVGGTGEFTTVNVTTLLTNLGGAKGNSTAGFAAGSAIALDPSNATGGTFTVANVIANTSGTGGGAVGVTKQGTNTLVLSANNTYTGPTTVNGGTLTLNQAGLADAANINLATGAVLNLTYSGTDTISQLLVDGVAQYQGSWGALTSGAARKTAAITGTGLLNVTAGPVETVTVTLGNLNQTYDGSPKAVSATTSPQDGLAVAITYNGSSTAPTVAGSYSVVATVTASGYIGTASGTLVIATAFDDWASGYGLTGANALTLADPNGDGLSNLVEYALGLNPTVPNSNPITLSDVTVNGSTYLQLSVNRNPAVTNVLIEGLSAANLTDANAWSTANTVNDPNNTTSVFTVRDALPISTTGKRFLRLRFTLLP